MSLDLNPAGSGSRVFPQCPPGRKKRDDLRIKNSRHDSVVKNPPADARDTGSIPDPRRSHRRRATWPVCHNHGAML